jgi:hypothetical protein
LIVGCWLLVVGCQRIITHTHTITSAHLSSSS